MSDSLDGKVAFITGAARGQGRSHAIQLAERGVMIIAVDLCAQIPTVAAPLATRDDLDETVELVEKAGGRIVASVADVRDLGAVREAITLGEKQLGRGVDIVLANAGIFQAGSPETDPEETFRDVIEVNLIGTWNTISAAAPGMIERGRGGSMVLTSSTQGMVGRGADGTAAMTGYTASKHGVVGLMRSAANWLAPHSIRVNSVHPTGVNTPMIMNSVIADYVESHPDSQGATGNAMPVDVVEPIDITNAIVYLVSDTARYVTGVTLPVDGGLFIR